MMSDFDDTQKLVNENNAGEVSLSEKVDKLLEAFESVNTYFIQKVADQIKVIDEMNPASINRVTIMAQMNGDIADIKARLQVALNKTTKEMKTLFQEAWKTVNQDPYFERVITEDPLTETAHKRLERYAESMWRHTAGTLQNISNTTAISKTYQQIIDKALLAVTSGLDSHTAELQRVIRELGSNGLQVEYESGHHRRLDSAARMNIVSAAHQIAQEGSEIMAETSGCDAKELSVHLNPAPDHAPVQGHIFMLPEFEKMQAGLPFQDWKGKSYEGFRRPIGEWNCMHYAMGFDTSRQKPKYTQAQLDDILTKNQQGFTWKGKHYSMYQGVQMMRKLETQIRREKDIAVAAKAAGDTDLQEKQQKRINDLGQVYIKLSDTAGLPRKWNRTVVQGFAKYKAKK